eukprot:scaffold264515_cov31-Tisochrysis_lutea.AAC.2
MACQCVFGSAESPNATPHSGDPGGRREAREAMLGRGWARGMGGGGAAERETPEVSVAARGEAATKVVMDESCDGWEAPDVRRGVRSGSKVAAKRRRACMARPSDGGGGQGSKPVSETKGSPPSVHVSTASRAKRTMIAFARMNIQCETDMLDV